MRNSEAANPTELARQAADRLVGTTLTLADLTNEMPDIEGMETDGAFCAALDQEIFCCQICDWWCPQCEMAEGSDWICEECASQ